MREPANFGRCHYVGMLLSCGLLLLQVGCSGGDAATPLSEPRTEAPQQWREGGRQWSLAGDYGAIGLYQWSLRSPICVAAAGC
jgi:hypothetical protein